MEQLQFQLKDGWYICDYQGASGAIQIIFAEEAEVCFLGDAGLNEFGTLSSNIKEQCIYNTKYILKYLNTAGLTTVRIKCSKKPENAIINIT